MPKLQSDDETSSDEGGESEYSDIENDLEQNNLLNLPEQVYQM